MFMKNLLPYVWNKESGEKRLEEKIFRGYERLRTFNNHFFLF